MQQSLWWRWSNERVFYLLPPIGVTAALATASSKHSLFTAAAAAVIIIIIIIQPDYESGSRTNPLVVTQLRLFLLTCSLLLVGSGFSCVLVVRPVAYVLFFLLLARRPSSRLCRPHRHLNAMSTGTLKKPSRPPPPPPTHDSYNFSIHNNNNNNHHPSNSSSSSSSVNFAYHRKSNSRLSDYIKISECSTGKPDRHQELTARVFGSNFSTTTSNGLAASFKKSATLRPSSHQKSLSLTENHLNLALPYELPPYEGRHNTTVRNNRHQSSARYSHNLSVFGSCDEQFDKTSARYGFGSLRHQQVDNRRQPSAAAAMSAGIEYKQVDFIKTEALTKCTKERTSGRGSDFDPLFASSNQRGE